MSRDRERVAVYRANGETQAQIIQGRLEASGIPSLLQSQAAPSVHAFAFDGMGEVLVMVTSDDAEAARKLLAEGN